ncbi:MULTISPECIES: GGDEF domain-containing protein [Caldimonas]|uniref:GGDEF domain-containing protein n=1 Tax=Caldimonas TaxID=196013 RepID=UPI00036A5D52|nr:MULTISPECIES: GGDEF domain-containing protein [Caldimonas]MCX7660357.1 diguanylate cyclase [Caldimonas manganoxidans]
MSSLPSSPDSRSPAGATQPAPLGSVQTPAQIAKAALRRLALNRLEPTPENYLRAYRAEAGESPDALVLPPAVQRLIEQLAQRLHADPAPLLEALARGRHEQAERWLADVPEGAGGDAQVWASLIQRLVKGVERGGRLWTSARKKESLQRVLAASRGDPARLRQRLQHLVATWDSDAPAESPVLADDPVLADALAGGAATPTQPAPLDDPLLAGLPQPAQGLDRSWGEVVADLAQAITEALPEDDPRCMRLRARLADLLAPLATQPDEDLAEDWRGWAADAKRLLSHRAHLTDQLRGLCDELSASLGELAEDGSWVQGQAALMREHLRAGLTARSVRSVSHLLHAARSRQGEIKAERARSRDMIKQLINSMVQRIGELGAHTGRFQDRMDRYVQVIEQADTLESLASVVKELVEDTRNVQTAVHDTHEQLRSEHAQAEALQQRVRELEAELQRLSAEVSTDPLTEVANRRGLIQAFEVEQARLQRQGGELAIGLLDIDNFKKLNDTLGHQTGDEALKFLAAHVKQALRPMDTVARYGGEEFVVLLPQTTAEEARVVLTRLQRTLSANFFMHDQRQVFVTFSAGVTVFRPGERLEEALDRADEALYEAKRTGKNRTCVA